MIPDHLMRYVKVVSLHLSHPHATPDILIDWTYSTSSHIQPILVFALFLLWRVLFGVIVNGVESLE